MFGSLFTLVIGDSGKVQVELAQLLVALLEFRPPELDAAVEVEERHLAQLVEVEVRGEVDQGLEERANQGGVGTRRLGRLEECPANIQVILNSKRAFGF